MLFTDGKHQAYERMMKQTPYSHRRSFKKKKKSESQSPSSPQKERTLTKERSADENQ